MNASNETGRTGGTGGDAERRPIRDGIDDARSQVTEVVAVASSSARDVLDKARSNGPAGTVDAYPVATLIGGIALGVAIGALLPRTEKESELFGDLGRRLQGGAREAAVAAREAGQSKFAELGFDREHARDTAQGFLSNILSAAAAAGTAALDSARNADTGRD